MILQKISYLCTVRVEGRTTATLGKIILIVIFHFFNFNPAERLSIAISCKTIFSALISWKKISSETITPINHVETTLTTASIVWNSIFWVNSTSAVRRMIKDLTWQVSGLKSRITSLVVWSVMVMSKALLSMCVTSKWKY